MQRNHCSARVVKTLFSINNVCWAVTSLDSCRCFFCRWQPMGMGQYPVLVTRSLYSLPVGYIRPVEALRCTCFFFNGGNQVIIMQGIESECEHLHLHVLYGFPQSQECIRTCPIRSHLRFQQWPTTIREEALHACMDLLSQQWPTTIITLN